MARGAVQSNKYIDMIFIACINTIIWRTRFQTDNAQIVSPVDNRHCTALECSTNTCAFYIIHSTKGMRVVCKRVRNVAALFSNNNKKKKTNHVLNNNKSFSNVCYYRERLTEY